MRWGHQYYPSFQSTVKKACVTNWGHGVWKTRVVYHAERGSLVRSSLGCFFLACTKQRLFIFFPLPSLYVSIVLNSMSVRLTKIKRGRNHSLEKFQQKQHEANLKWTNKPHSLTANWQPVPTKNQCVASLSSQPHLTWNKPCAQESKGLS